MSMEQGHAGVYWYNPPYLSMPTTLELHSANSNSIYKNIYALPVLLRSNSILVNKIIKCTLSVVQSLNA